MINISGASELYYYGVYQVYFAYTGRTEQGMAPPSSILSLWDRHVRGYSKHLFLILKGGGGGGKCEKATDWEMSEFSPNSPKGGTSWLCLTNQWSIPPPVYRIPDWPLRNHALLENLTR